MRPADRGTGITDSHADATQQQDREIARLRGQSAEAREDGDGDRNDSCAAAPLRQPRNRQAEERVKDRKAQALNHAELRVAQLRERLRAGAIAASPWRSARFSTFINISMNSIHAR